ADVAQRAQHRRDMAVRQRAAHDDAFLIDRRHLAALEQGAQPFDDLGRPIGQVGDGALLDLVGVAIALAQQDRGRRISVGDRFDIHGTTVPRSPQNSKSISPFTWLHFLAIFRKAPPNSTPYSFRKKEVGPRRPFSRKQRWMLAMAFWSAAQIQPQRDKV